MIKINLLSPERKEVPGAGPEAPSFSDEKKSAKLNVPSAIAAAVITIGVIGFLYFTQTQAIDKLETDLRDRETQKNSLKDVEENLKKLEKAKKDVTQKVDLINKLKQIQTSAVIMMDKVSLSLPEWVWLTSLTFRNNALAIRGRTISNNLIADFINNLKATENFINIEFQQSAKKMEGGQEIYDFALSCSYQDESQKKSSEKNQAKDKTVK